MIPCLSPNGQTHFELDSPLNRLLVGTATGVVDIRRDGPSAPWREVRRTLVGKHIGALINAPGDRLFAGCHANGGLHRSVDGGETWENVGKALNGTDVFSLAVLDAPEGPAILAGTEPVNLYRSNDFGGSWQEYPSIASLPGAENWSFPPLPHIPHLKSMSMIPGSPESFYACVEQGALLRTEDAGKTWTDFHSLWNTNDEIYHDAHRLIVAPWNSKLLILTSGLGVFRSDDAGATWTRNSQVASHTIYPDVAVASASDRSLYIGGPADVPIEWFRGDAQGTICRSDDEGLTWKPANHGLASTGRPNIEGLSIVSHPGGYTLLAGDTDGHLFSSVNRGEDWLKILTVDAISKGAHYRLAQVSAKLPQWAGSGATMLMGKVFGFTAKRALNKRRSDFRRRAANG